MNDADVDRRLGALLRQPLPAADPAFADLVVAAARIDRDIRRAQSRAWKRAAADCAGAAVVAWSFYLLSQAQVLADDSTIPVYGTAMAGLVMLGLWALVSLPVASGARRAA